jgi:hypothetical protein
MLTEFESIDVRSLTVFENKAQLVLRSVKTSHARVVFGPNDKVL